MGGLTAIPKDLYEAAELDGAGPLKRFFSITLPLLRPFIFIAIVWRTVDLFRIFDVVWALTQGGPGTMTETISIYTYVQGFKQFETSYTAAIAFLVIVLLTIVVVAALKRMEIAR